MKRLVFAVALIGCGGAAWGEDVANAPGAKLRFLDRLSGAVQDLVLAKGQSKAVGNLTVQLDQCRYYPENPAAEAFAHLTIVENQSGTAIFKGYMVASSPALSALDHPRYDVWVLRCDVPDLALPEVVPAPEDGGQGEGDATDDGNG